MSFATASPGRTPASKRPDTMSVRPESTLSSTLMSGYAGSSRRSAGQSAVVAACSEAVMRSEPAGRFRSSPRDSSWAPTLSKAGPTVAISLSPASVAATLRVVRVSRRTPSLVSSRRIVWLRADCEVPSLAAARARRIPGLRHEPCRDR